MTRTTTLKQKLVCGAFAAIAILPTAMPALAAYPDRPIRIITPYEPGAMVDSTTRAVAEGLSRKLGQPVIVENKAGGMGQIAMSALLNSPSDGYTLLSDTPASAINPTLNKSKYNPKTDIAPITQYMKLPFAIAVTPSLKVDTAKDLVALGKAKPESFNVAVAGTSTGLMGDLFGIQNGFKFTNVPYKGAGPAMLALLKGEAQVIFMDAANIAPHVKAGKMKALLVTGDHRFVGMPDVPTAKEAGYASFTPTTWFGLFARADVPKDIQQKLNEAVREVMATQQLQDFLKQRGASYTPMSVGEFDAFFDHEVDQWADVITKADIQRQ